MLARRRLTRSSTSRRKAAASTLALICALAFPAVAGALSPPPPSLPAEASLATAKATPKHSAGVRQATELAGAGERVAAPAARPLDEAREARQRGFREHREAIAARQLERHEAQLQAAQEHKALSRARHAEAHVRLVQTRAALAQARTEGPQAVKQVRAESRAARAARHEGGAGRASAGPAGGASAPSSSTGAVAAPAPVVTAPPTVAPPAPTSVPLRHRSARARHRSATPVRRHSPTAGHAGTLAPAGIATAAPAANTVRHPRRPAPRHSTAAARRPTTLVTTVTRIISVVPWPLRALIVALAAIALAFAVSSRVSALRARRLARQRRELLEDVGLLQAALLPELPERLGPVATSAAYRPASGPAAGGDFFDVFALADGRLGVIVGDISGHGRQALPQTTNVRFTLRTYLEAGSSPRASLQAAAGVLDRQLGDSFATVVLATYDPRERLLVYACAGHPAPLVIGDQPIAHLSSCSAPPLGVGQPTGTRETRVRLPGAATVCFYTDGVVEARRKGELYGRERLARAVLELGPHERATDLLDRIARESESHTDDMAACILRVPGPSEQPVLEREQIEVDGAEAGRERVLRLLLAAGVAADSARSVLASARRLVREHGRVVLDVDLMDTPPSVELWPQNLSVLPPAGHRQAGAATGA